MPTASKPLTSRPGLEDVWRVWPVSVCAAARKVRSMPRALSAKADPSPQPLRALRVSVLSGAAVVRCNI